MSKVSEILQRSSRAVNSVLGDLCIFDSQHDGFISDINIVINKNNEVWQQGVLVGYDLVAAILKDDVPNLAIADTFINSEDGVSYRIEMVIKNTESKFYCNITQI